MISKTAVQKSVAVGQCVPNSETLMNATGGSCLAGRGFSSSGLQSEYFQ